MSAEFHQLQGRILACEMMQARLLNLLATVFEPDDPASMLGVFERETMAGLQHIDVPIGPEADIVWGTAGEELRQRFAIARGILRTDGPILTADSNRPLNHFGGTN